MDPSPFVIEVFFDGACPLCTREIAFMRRRDTANRIRFTDIASASFDAHALDTTQEELMERIHGRLPDGTWLEGVEVFRRLYDAIGFRWLVRLTRLPLISYFLDLAYVVFAKNRLRLTGRCEAEGCAVDLRAKASRREGRRSSAA